MQHEKKQLVCAIYRRVSSDKQVEEGWSLDEQKEVLLEHAKKNNYIVYDVYTDEGISAKSIKERKDMLRLLNDIEEDHIDVIVAWKLSRTFRNLKEQLEAMELMKKHKVFFDFKSDGIINFNEPTGVMYAQCLGMISEFERSVISDNVYLGMSAAIKAGHWVGGASPYGYTIWHDPNVKRGSQKLVIKEDEAQVVRRIFDMFVNGDEDCPSGAGYKHICNVLNHEGILTQHGKNFSIGTISGIIQNPVYCGYIRWGMHRKWSEMRRKGTTTPMIYKGIHEPIISEELFKKAEAIRIAKGGKAQRTYKDTRNILTGILKCPRCGASMVLSRTGAKGKKIEYYACGNWHNKGSSVCTSHLVLLDETNSVVLDKIAEICTDELIIRGVLKRLNKNKCNKIEGSERDQADLEKMIEKVQRDIISLQRRFESDTCDIDVQEYKRRIKELRANEETYNTRLSELKISIGKYQSEKTYTIEELRDIFTRVRDILDKADVVALRTLMHLMIEKITIDSETRKPDSMTIKFNKVLTDYLCINNEEEAHKASSFSVVMHKELVFEVDL